MNFVSEWKLEHAYMLSQIGNVDQTPVLLDMPSRTMSAKGEQPVRPITTGNEHNHLTVMLCCTADGHKRPPFIVFKCKTMPKEKFLSPPPLKSFFASSRRAFLRRRLCWNGYASSGSGAQAVTSGPKACLCWACSEGTSWNA